MKKSFAQTLLAAFATIWIANIALASTGVTGTITVTENRSKGRTYSITVKPDGSFETGTLAPGSYTFKCDLTASDAAALPLSGELEYHVVTAREQGSGMATGRKINKVEALVVKQKVAHSASATWSSIAIDEQGVHLTGKIMMKDAAGKTKVIWSPRSN